LGDEVVISMKNGLKADWAVFLVEDIKSKDNNFKQLHTPFPFYVNINDFMDERKVEEVIWLMNKNLHSYYKLAMSESK